VPAEKPGDAGARAKALRKLALLRTSIERGCTVKVLARLGG